jgi:hypothetical protein
MEEEEGYLPNGNHELAAQDFLVISRSAACQARCVTVGACNMIQVPNAITNQSVILLGARGDDRRVPDLHSELASNSLPPLDNAFHILCDTGYTRRVDGGGLYTGHYLGNLTHSKNNFISRGPTHFLLAFEVMLPSTPPDLHFEAIILKKGEYWLLTGVSKAKVLRLGNLQQTGALLFSPGGRDALLDQLRTEYSRGGDRDLMVQWANACTPFLVVPSMNLPGGYSKSIWDTFASPDEVREALLPDMSVRKDRNVTKLQRTAVQVIDLDNPNDVSSHTVRVAYEEPWGYQRAIES